MLSSHEPIYSLEMLMCKAVWQGYIAAELQLQDEYPSHRTAPRWLVNHTLVFLKS